MDTRSDGREVLVRYKLPVVVIVMNNGGVYGGDRRPASEKANAFASDPAPTAFVPNIKYEMLMGAFGGKGYVASTVDELAKVCKDAFAAREPALINVIIDPFAGTESGQLHGMN
ncbi:hypothetical protein CBR_g39224 [Chara braunii]|uniref:2-hydroxyacyl-CoA lyase n=1 Tax=Chara braunii TaxID=69332 RepID=A0A388LR84_CHABU|nr:hypothetical protein CBR_g39224 [Chara braunii]|eukprot:GBG84848.1 hypothetical protein CBR_g39224 [Chara braunii]